VPPTCIMIRYRGACRVREGVDVPPPVSCWVVGVCRVLCEGERGGGAPTCTMLGCRGKGAVRGREWWEVPPTGIMMGCWGEGAVRGGGGRCPHLYYDGLQGEGCCGREWWEVPPTCIT